MIRRSLNTALFGLILHGPVPAIAQGADLAEIGRQIDILAEVLQEGLGLDAAPGFLGINAGRISSYYLQGQGVLFEIRTPLANQRNRVSLTALATSIRSRSPRGNPFDMLAMDRSPQPDTSNSVLSDTAELAFQAYRQSLENARAMDLQVAIENALRQAGMQIRMLRDLDAQDSGWLEAAEGDLDTLRERLYASLAELRQLGSADTEAAAQSATGTDTATPLPDNSRLQLLLEELAEIRSLAASRTEELSSRYQQAREAYRQRWQQDVGQFESNLYELLCNYGASVRELPDGEYLTVVLTGLGDEDDDGRPGDKLHVISKADMSACQAAAIDVQELAQRASHYSF